MTQKEKIVVQISIDILIDKEDYTFDFDEKVKCVLENAGYDVCGTDCATSWNAKEYFC